MHTSGDTYKFAAATATTTTPPTPHRHCHHGFGYQKWNLQPHPNSKPKFGSVVCHWWCCETPKAHPILESLRWWFDVLGQGLDDQFHPTIIASTKALMEWTKAAMGSGSDSLWATGSAVLFIATFQVYWHRCFFQKMLTQMKQHFPRNRAFFDNTP